MAKLEIEILTLFPRMCEGYLKESILGKAQESGLISIRVADIREHAQGKHKVADDAPYGGGAGMVMKPEPIYDAIDAAKARLPGAKVILTSPRGEVFSQRLARKFAESGKLIVICGRYEGVDERVAKAADIEVSMGDFVMTGGELAALCIADATARMVPGTLGNEESAGGMAGEGFESFAGAEGGLLEYPQYTRPQSFRGMDVPAVLLSGDHRRIERWRRREALCMTKSRRPDLFAKVALSEADRRLLDENDDSLMS